MTSWLHFRKLHYDVYAAAGIGSPSRLYYKSVMRISNNNIISRHKWFAVNVNCHNMQFEYFFHIYIDALV